MEIVFVHRVMLTSALMVAVSVSIIKAFNVDNIGVPVAFIVLAVTFTAIAALIISTLWLIWHI